MRKARSYQTGHHPVTQNRKTYALRCPGDTYAGWNSNYRGRGKPKEKPLFERVPKLAYIPGTAGEENLAIQDKTSILKPTTPNRSTRKGFQGYGRVPRVKPSQILTATVVKHHRRMLTVTCLAYPSPVTIQDSRALIDDGNQLRNTARIPRIETKPQTPKHRRQTVQKLSQRRSLEDLDR